MRARNARRRPGGNSHPPKAPRGGGRGAKGGGKGKGKGAKKGAKGGSPAIPAEFEGYPTVTDKGERICYAFNINAVGCPLAQPGQTCIKGKHVCPACFGPHSMHDPNCPAKRG